jgi:hypothetical protein
LPAGTRFALPSAVNVILNFTPDCGSERLTVEKYRLNSAGISLAAGAATAATKGKAHPRSPAIIAR